MEEWRPVDELEGAYSVSSLGRVRREKAVPGAVPGRILSPKVDKDGYLEVLLMVEGKRFYRRVHRLVCMAFHGEPPEGKNLVLHWNDLKSDNRAENLRWGSYSDNQEDSIRNERHFGSKKTECLRGHDISEDSENTYWQNGKRSCIVCRRAASRKSYRNRRGYLSGSTEISNSK